MDAVDGDGGKVDDVDPDLSVLIGVAAPFVAVVVVVAAVVVVVVVVVVAAVDVVVDKLSGSPTTGNRMSFSSFRIFWKRVEIGLITEDNQGFEPLTS